MGFPAVTLPCRFSRPASSLTTCDTRVRKRKPHISSCGCWWRPRPVCACVCDRQWVLRLCNASVEARFNTHTQLDGSLLLNVKASWPSEFWAFLGGPEERRIPQESRRKRVVKNSCEWSAAGQISNALKLGFGGGPHCVQRVTTRGFFLTSKERRAELSHLRRMSAFYKGGTSQSFIS